MCGIVGAWLQQPLPQKSLDASLAAIAHRGPDDCGSIRKNGVVLGMRRLAIIDLETGQQPIANEDQTVHAVCNGEIYNYRELTRELKSKGHVFRSNSDAEVLVHLYEDLGESMCERLSGMYAFAIYDSRRSRLLLARDRFGKKPLYYARSPGGGILFASELKALRPLARSAGLELKISEQAIYDYLSAGCVPQPATIYEGVASLPMGSWLSFEDGAEQTKRYWEVDYGHTEHGSYDETLERIRETISQAVRIRLRSDVPLGVFLSGGIDSSVVAYEAARHTGASLQTFTVGMDDEQFDESAQAARTAARYGVRHTVLPLKVTPLKGLLEVVRQYDQPFWDSSAIPSLAIAKLARQYVSVVLTGDGGDELFAGYRHHLAPWAADRLTWVPRLAFRAVSSTVRALRPARRSALGFLSRFAAGFSLSSGARHIAWTTDLLREEDKREIWTGSEMRPTEDWVETLLPEGLSALRTHLHGDIEINLLSDMLVKVDIATMASSLEARSPLLDHELAELVFSLPDAYLLGRGRRKKLLRDAYRGIVPHEVLEGRKMGFEIPLASWMDTDFREILHDTLGSETAIVRTMIRPNVVDDLLNKRIFADRNWAQIAYAFLILELWLGEFGH